MNKDEWYSVLVQLYSENLKVAPTFEDVRMFFEQGYTPEDTYEAKANQAPATIVQTGTTVVPEKKPSDHLKEVLESPEYPHLTEQDILARVIDKQFFLSPSGTMVLCELTMQNHWRHIGKWAPMSGETFELEKGKSRALTDAIREAWDSEAYLLKERMYQQYLQMRKEGN